MLPSALLFLLVAALGAGPGATFPHSHNDYERAHPLTEALSLSYGSVEADVRWANDQVVVSHGRHDAKVTLQALYLDPLQARVNGLGSVLGDGRPFLLWLDLKEAGPQLLDALAGLLGRYPMFSPCGGQGPVVAVLTGNPHAKRVLVDERGVRACRDSNRFSPADPPADGRWTWYALRWSDLFVWDGRGQFPVSERERLHALVRSVHEKGRRVRFYQAPETDAYFEEAVAAGVDLVGADHLVFLRAFLVRDRS